MRHINHRKKSIIENYRRGSVMFVVIMVLVIVSIIGVLALATSHYNNKLSGNEVRRKRAFYVAESGAMLAIEALNADKTVHGVIFQDKATPGGTYTVEIFDSTDFSWLDESDRIIRSIGKSRNAVRRLEYRVTPTHLGYGDIPGPLYIEDPDPHFAGNVFTVQGPDHHFNQRNYYIPTPPGDHRAAVTTIHDSTSIVNAIGNRDDQIYTVYGDTMAMYYPSINPDYDTLDLQALADIYAGPNGEYADTTDFVYGQYPGNYKVSYFPGDAMVAGGGHSGGGGGQIPCENCGGTGIITCYGCDGSGYEWHGEVCANCGGDGIVGCATCDSMGYFTCPDCGGTGGEAIACDSCDGTGLYGCPECYGTGVCPICHGTGYWRENKKDKWSCYRCGTGGKNDPPGTGICPDCNGLGAIDCPFCGGTGVDPSSGCPTCGGTGVISCPDCGGDGYVVCPVCNGSGGSSDARICNVCKGDGWIKCPYCFGNGTLPSLGSGAGPAGTVGAGVMVVRGDLHISGQFEFVGLVIVLGDVSTDITGGGQGIHIWGSLLCKSVDFKISGNADVCWCSDALKRIEPRYAGFQVASVIEY